MAKAQAEKKKFVVGTVDVSKLEDALNSADANGYDVFTILEEGGDRNDVTLVLVARNGNGKKAAKADEENE